MTRKDIPVDSAEGTGFVTCFSVLRASNKTNKIRAKIKIVHDENLFRFLTFTLFRLIGSGLIPINFVIIFHILSRTFGCCSGILFILHDVFSLAGNSLL